MRRGPLRAVLVSALTLSLLLTGLPVTGGASRALAAEGTGPELLISEIVPTSQGTGQPYEFVEVYNPTLQPVDLEGYELQYFTSSPYETPANRWPIIGSVVPPRAAKVLWLKKFNYPDVPLEDFNANYGVSLSPDQVFEVRLTTAAQGLHDSALRRVGIARPDGTLVTAAYINAGEVDGTGHANQSVTYSYAAAVDAARIANGQPATPGEIIPEQNPLIPFGLTAAPGDGTVTLTWHHTEGWGVTGYRIYQDGALAGEAGTEAAWVATGLTNDQAYEFAVTSLDALEGESSPATVSATPSGEPEPPAVPRVLITEAIANTANHYEGLDAYEFVELFNPGSEPVSLEGYSLRAGAAGSTGGWTATIDQPLTLPPGGTLVAWPRRGELRALPLESFNLYYFGAYPARHLPPEQLWIIDDVPGLVNTGAQTIILRDSAGEEVARATYNDGSSDTTQDESVIWTYPVDGSTAMRKIGTGAPTPGLVLPEQRPPSADAIAPEAPSALSATAGAGSVSLAWSPVEAADLAGYNVYRDGAWELFVPAPAAGTTVSLLTGGVSYAFAVTAVDLAGNESAPSEAVSATPAHEPVTQAERAAHTPDERYELFLKVSQPGPVVPGALEGLVPQAIAHWPEQDWMITSNYLTDGRPSVLTVVDLASGQLVKSLRLYQEDGAPYVGHAGGIAVSSEHLWIASDSQVYWIPLSELAAAPDGGSLTFGGRFGVEGRASFLSFADGVLWVGEFHRPSTHPTEPHHALTARDGSPYNAWVSGYRLDGVTDLIARTTAPDMILAVADRIQGMAVSQSFIILSQSYGRNVDSTLYRYLRPDTTGAPDLEVALNGEQVPVWFLDGLNLAQNHGQMLLPPLSEGLQLVGDAQLYVLFESGANEYYHTAFSPLERMQVVDLGHWDSFGQLRLEGLPDVLVPGETASLRAVIPQGEEPALDVTALAAYSVHDPAVAAVAANGTLTALAEGETVLSVSYGGQTIELPVRVAAVAEVLLLDVPQRLAVGETVQVRVEALLADGTRRDVTAEAALTATHGGTVAIGEGGLLTGVKPGEVRLTAEYAGVRSAVSRLTVRPAQAGGPRE